VLGVEAVVLLHRHPGELAALLADRVAQLRPLGLQLCELIAGGLPLLAGSNVVIGHRYLLVGLWWGAGAGHGWRAAVCGPLALRPASCAELIESMLARCWARRKAWSALLAGGMIGQRLRL
jgi:hypothetical protein